MIPPTNSSVLLGGQRYRLPDFFIVGAPKTGSTALYEMMKSHPQIYMPAVKEPEFFSTDLPDQHPEAHPHLPTTLTEYLALFSAAKPGQRVGEASILYLFSGKAAANIKALAPAARIIAIVREPASLVCSLHLQNLRNDDESETRLKNALRLEADRREGRCIPNAMSRLALLLYSEHARYVDQLRRYHDAFGREQVLVLVYDDFRQRNEDALRRVLRFVDVDDGVDVEPHEANRTVRIRSRWLDDLVYSVSVGSGPISRRVNIAAKAVTPTRFRRHAVGIAWRAAHPAPRSPDKKVMIALRRRFKPEVQALSEYLGRDLVTLWGYDSVD